MSSRFYDDFVGYSLLLHLLLYNVSKYGNILYMYVHADCNVGVLYYTVLAGRKMAVKRDDAVMLTPHMIKSSVLLNKTAHAVSLSQEAATSLLQLKRATTAHSANILHKPQARLAGTECGLMYDDLHSRAGANKEGEERRTGSSSSRVVRNDGDSGAVRVASGVNSDMLGTLIMRKAMSLLHTARPTTGYSEEEVEEEGAESITVLLSNSPEPEDFDDSKYTTHSQEVKATYAPTPSVLRKTASLPARVESPLYDQAQANKPVLLTARLRNVLNTVKVECDTSSGVSRTTTSSSAGASCLRTTNAGARTVSLHDRLPVFIKSEKVRI